MAAGIYSFVLEQGVDWSQTFVVDANYSLTGKKARGAIRETPTGALLGTLTCTISGQNLTVDIPSAVSAAIDGTLTKLVYDVEIYTDEGTPAVDVTVDRLLKGTITFDAEVTHE